MMSCNILWIYGSNLWKGKKIPIQQHPTHYPRIHLHMHKRFDDRKTGAPNPYFIHTTYTIFARTHSYGMIVIHTRTRKSGERILIVVVFVRVSVGVFAVIRLLSRTVWLLCPDCEASVVVWVMAIFSFFSFYVCVCDYPDHRIHRKHEAPCVKLFSFVCTMCGFVNGGMLLCVHVCVRPFVSVCCVYVRRLSEFMHAYTHTNVSLSFSTLKQRVFVCVRMYENIFSELNFYAAWMLYGFCQKPTC